MTRVALAIRLYGCSMLIRKPTCPVDMAANFLYDLGPLEAHPSVTGAVLKVKQNFKPNKPGVVHDNIDS